MGLMLDSTVLIDAERKYQELGELVDGVTERFGNQPLSMSIISAGELFHGMWRSKGERRRRAREKFVEDALEAFEVVDVTLPVIRIFGRVDAGLREDGTIVPTADLLIACSALFVGDDVATRNVRHFRKVPGLTVHEFG